MSNHTFTPGDTVVHDATGVRGTLTSTNGVSAVVQWDAAGVAMPADILPVTDLVQPAAAPAGLEAFTLEEIQAEMQRRLDEAHARHLEAALLIMRNRPDLITDGASVTDVCGAGDDSGLPWAVMAEAWSIVRKEAGK